jgi:hypothetical protein
MEVLDGLTGAPSCAPALVRFRAVTYPMLEGGRCGAAVTTDPRHAGSGRTDWCETHAPGPGA